MKHHFADYLNNGHFNFTPNLERWCHHYDDLMLAADTLEVVTITKNDRNWQRIFALQDLKELTLHEPNAEQLRSLTKLPKLRRLRLTMARPKTLEFLEGQDLLEELVFEYVSGIKDLSCVGDLQSLRALHLENLRRVQDFSGLKGAKKLKYLSIDGTLDWSQRISDLHFLQDLSVLEHLRIMNVRVLDAECPLAPIAEHATLHKVQLSRAAFTLEDFAWLEAKRPDLDGAVQQPFVATGGYSRKLSADDFRAKISEGDLISQNFHDIVIKDDGERYEELPYEAYLLGKGERIATGNRSTVEARCAQHEARYRKLVESYL